MSKILINHLKKKSVNIIITNVCNLSCGGCSQQCGNFTKKQLFFISEDQLKKNIEVASKMHKFVHLFGGEACLHPDIEKFLSFCTKYENNTFFIWTNGRYKTHNNKVIKTQYVGTSYQHADYKNVIVQTDFDKKGRTFIPTLVAPKDVLNISDDSVYFKYAQENCFMWKYCQLLFYDKYAYACECAGSFDKITNFDKGWEIKENFLDDLVDEDVVKQLNNFCYRCGHCLPQDIKEKYKQKTEEKSLYTITNMKIANQKNIKL